MPDVARWNAKWDNLGVDSDGESTGTPSELDATSQRVLQCFPRETAAAVAREKCSLTRNALLALNCYIIELNSAPKDTPMAHQELLTAICEAMQGFGEELQDKRDMLRLRVLETLSHPRVHPRHVEHAVGAMAMLPQNLRDPLLAEFVLRASAGRLPEFSAHCLVCVCWSASTLSDFDAAAALLHSAVALVEQRAHELGAGDVATFSWACAVAQPPGAQRALRAVLQLAELPKPGTLDARVASWASECFGLDAEARFGPPPTAVPAELAAGLHGQLVAAARDEGATWLGRGQPRVLQLDGLLAPEEAAALLAATGGRWARSAVALGEASKARSSEGLLLETLAGLPVPILVRVRRRAAKLLGLPESHCEPAQVLRYLPGQSYEEHVDYFPAEPATRGLLYLGGQRVATVLVYLATVPDVAGGQTVFSRLDASAGAVVGRALVWLNVRPDGEVEDRTAHTSAPITDELAVKYCLKLWFHAYPVMQAEPTASPGLEDDAPRELGAQPIPPPAGPLEAAGALGEQLRKLACEAGDPVMRAAAHRLLQGCDPAAAGAREAPEAYCPAPPMCPPQPMPLAMDDVEDVNEDIEPETWHTGASAAGTTGEARPAPIGGASARAPDFVMSDSDTSELGPAETRVNMDLLLATEAFSPAVPSCARDFEEVD